MEYLEDISSETTLKSFPAKYNADNKALVDEINRLNTAIAARDEQINKLRRAFNEALGAFQAEYLSKIKELDDKINELYNHQNT